MLHLYPNELMLHTLFELTWMSTDLFLENPVIIEYFLFVIKQTPYVFD